MKTQEIDQITVQPTTTISAVISVIENSGSIACALLYDKEKFLNVITDGDVRRAFLVGYDLESSALEIQKVKVASARPHTITAPTTSTDAELKKVFNQYSLRQIVLTDANGSPEAVIDQKEIQYESKLEKKKFNALIMAGGYGTRLLPLTEDTPKPMLPINGKPMLERIILKLVETQVNKIYISTHYLSGQICQYFGNGEKFGANIHYIHESNPRGTGGALSDILDHETDLLVFNGDILTNLNIDMFFGFHSKSNAAMTIAVTQFGIDVPFGVISTQNTLVEKIEEKPTIKFLVNSGIYFISSEGLRVVPKDNHFDMVDFADLLIKSSMDVRCFPIYEKWMDIGRPDDFERANDMF